MIWDGSITAPIPVSLCGAAPHDGAIAFVGAARRPARAVWPDTRLHYAIDFNGDGITHQVLTSARPITLRHAYRAKGFFNLIVKISTSAGHSVAIQSTRIRIT